MEMNKIRKTLYSIALVPSMLTGVIASHSPALDH